MSDVLNDDNRVLADEDVETTGVMFDDEPFSPINPVELASKVALLAADDIAQVDDFISATDVGDGVTDFRFKAVVPGYEGWQWSVTLFHDEIRGTWTVCESSLVPTQDSLLPPPWIPWKDRLEPSDLSPTDSIGTDEDDPRLEDGFRPEATHAVPDENAAQDGQAGSEGVKSAPAAQGEQKEQGEQEQESADTSTDDAGATPDEADHADEHGGENASPASADSPDSRDAESAAAVTAVVDEAAKEKDERAEAEEIAEEFNLSRRRVLSPLGRSKAAERWYDGPRGPKALSTQTAEGKICQTCGFYVSIQGDLGRLFGVCANKWSPDDGKVVSVDHGCGEHSEIAPPPPTPMWIQTEPALDDDTIEIVRRTRRDENAGIEMMEAEGYGSRRRHHADDADDADIDANVVSAESDDEEEETADSDHTSEIEYEESLDVSVLDDENDDESDNDAVDDADDATDDDADDADDATDDDADDDMKEETDRAVLSADDVAIPAQAESEDLRDPAASTLSEESSREGMLAARQEENEENVGAEDTDAADTGNDDVDNEPVFSLLPRDDAESAEETEQTGEKASE